VSKTTCARILALTAIVALTGCAGKPKPPPALPDAGGCSIQAEAAGLAPSGEERFRTIDFALFFGDRDSISGWAVSIVEAKRGTVVKKVQGGVAELPDKFTWDGNDDSGMIASEGSYVATLAVDYAGKFKPGRASSKSFVLAVSPPGASFSPNPAQFAYAPDGIPKPIAVAVAAKSGLAKISQWSIAVYDSAGNQVKALSGPLSQAKAVWDGKTDSGGYVETAETYPAVLTVTDEFGLEGSFKGAFSVADVPSAGPCSIETRRIGFSPTSSSVKNTLGLHLSLGSKANLQSWRVEVLGVEKGNAVAVRSFEGGPGDIPDSIDWDGKNDSGSLVAEGSYFATLELDYGKAYKPARAKSRSFSVVMTPPTGSVTVDPPVADLSALGPKKPVNLTVQAKSAYAQIASWVMAVYDESGVSIVMWNGNWPKNKVAWDGKTVEGASLVPGMRYKVVAKVQDEYGNVGDMEGGLATEGLTPPTEPSSIEALSGGLAPTGDGSHGTIAFELSAGNAESLETWEVGIVGEQNVVEKTFKGEGKKLPERLEWDGRIDNGSFAPEGRYSAMLTLSYGMAYAPALLETKRFVLDLSPPAGSIAVSTSLFSPDGDGADDVATITLSGASSLARIVGWSLVAYDPGNSPFMSWKGAWPPSPIAWDGAGSDGSSVESASDYPLVLKLRDEFGNVGVAKANLSTDILAVSSGDGYRIRVSSIVFKGYTADYKDLSPALAARNLTTLDLLAAKLKMPKFVDYKVRLEGHAVMINWDDERKGQGEQAAVLVPLSKSRSEAIKAALMERGVSGDRLFTEGVGAADPLVPDSDFANRWKNRRVEFYLIK
jgi:flagellar hook assembly protein FlgD